MGLFHSLGKLLAFGVVDVNQAGRGGTALFLASKFGQEDCVKTLLAAGANVNQSCMSKARGIGRLSRFTALMAASEHDNVKCLVKLLAAGADVNRPNERGTTALMLAHQNVECMKLLLEAGADVNKVDRTGETALTKASSTVNAQCIEVLLDAGADVNKKSLYGTTPLLEAALFGAPTCVEMLLDAGADVNTANGSGETPLMSVSHRGCKKSVARLLAAGAHVNSTDRKGKTPLTYSMSSEGNVTCVKLLLDAGADVNKSDCLYDAAQLSVHQSTKLASLVCVLKAGANVKVQALHNQLTLFTLLAGYGFPPVENEAAQLLVAAGVEMTHDWEMDIVSLTGEFERPKPLLQIQCRRVIRRHLLSVSDVNLFHQVERLPLPKKIKQFLVFQISLDEYADKAPRRGSS